MEVEVDALGRIVLPKQLRDALSIKPGAVVDVCRYGDGLLIVVPDKPWMRHAGMVDSGDEESSDSIDEVVYGDGSGDDSVPHP